MYKHNSLQVLIIIFENESFITNQQKCRAHCITQRKGHKKEQYSTDGKKVTHCDNDNDTDLSAIFLTTLLCGAAQFMFQPVVTMSPSAHWLRDCLP